MSRPVTLRHVGSPNVAHRRRVHPVATVILACRLMKNQATLIRARDSIVVTALTTNTRTMVKGQVKGSSVMAPEQPNHKQRG